WLGFGWFIFNAIAIGSASRGREIAVAIAGWVGTAVMFAGLVAIAIALHFDKSDLRYLRLSLVVSKLLIAYALQFSQARGFELFPHFGGRGRNGVALVVVGFVLREPIANAVGPVLSVVLL